MIVFIQEINHGSQNVFWVSTWVGEYYYFIPSRRRGIQFTNISQPMLKLKTHAGFHELFRFWYVEEYKYGSIYWLEDGNLYLRLRTISHTIYATQFEQTIIHQHVLLRRDSQSHIHLRWESQSYWWNIRNNNSVCMF
jgi:hypothetical protein